MFEKMDGKEGTPGGGKADVDGVSVGGEMDVSGVEWRMLLGRVGMKLLRFVFLGHLYYSYEVLDCVQSVSLERFPRVYLYAWTVVSVALGLFLFVFGRPTLTSGDAIHYIVQVDRRRKNSSVFCSVLAFVMDGQVYRYVNILLNFLWPYVVVSALCCYCRLRISHSRFLVTYYVSLTFAHLNKPFALIRWTAHTLTILIFLALSSHVHNWWGVLGAVSMLPSMLLVANDNHNYVFSSKLWGVRGHRTAGSVVHAVIASLSSFAITSSFVDMSSYVDGEERNVAAVTKQDLLNYLAPAPFLAHLVNQNYPDHHPLPY